MKSKKKLIVIAAPLLLLVVAAGAYKMLLAPKKAEAKPKIEGSLVTLAEPFVLNLASDRYAKVSVALVLANMPAAAEPVSAETPVPVPQEAAVRAVVTDTLTGLPASALVERASRHRLEVRLRKAIDAATDNQVSDVLLTDLTIQ